MALSPTRKWLNISFGLIVLAFVGVLLWPLITRPFALKAFCDELQPEMPIGHIPERASQLGFKVASPHNSVAHVYDHRSLGKFSCTIRIRQDKVLTSSFSFGDEAL